MTVNADHLIVAIIPARGGSKRLPKKNIFSVAGRPMLFWAVQACKRSAYVRRVFVSTEDAEIRGVALESGAEVIDRPLSLAGDTVFKQDVICHGVQHLRECLGLDPDVVLSVQPNSPQLNAEDVDRAIETFYQFNRKEIFSVDRDLMQNAAFRIMSSDVVFLKSLSIHAGVFVADYKDIHTLDDVRELEATGELQRRLAGWELSP